MRRKLCFWTDRKRNFANFLSTGVVGKMPTLVVSGFAVLAAIICEFSGIILSTLVQQHKQNFEFQLQQTADKYKELFEVE